MPSDIVARLALGLFGVLHLAFGAELMFMPRVFTVLYIPIRETLAKLVHSKALEMVHLIEFYWGSANVVLGITLLWLSRRGSPSSVRFGLLGMVLPLVGMYAIKNVLNEHLFAPFMYSSSMLVDAVLAIVCLVGALFSKSDRQAGVVDATMSANTAGARLMPGETGRLRVRPVSAKSD